MIGFSESTGDRAGLLHDMLVAVLRREGTFHVLGRVGGGYTDEQRKEMLSDLKDMVVNSEYSEVSADHVAYQMVRPEWVVEISCLDLVSQNTRGGPVGRMVLDWHANNGHSLYRTLRRLPLASVISPQFVRRRDDKQVQPTDVRITQLADLVELPQADKDSRTLVLPKSEVLRREVYLKELKGEQMVRKLVLWKTNKEQAADDFPAYVVHLTDFSPNRKDPLARELRISSSFEQIQQLFDQLKTENITKGWNLHSEAQTIALSLRQWPTLRLRSSSRRLRQQHRPKLLLRRNGARSCRCGRAWPQVRRQRNRGSRAAEGEGKEEVGVGRSRASSAISWNSDEARLRPTRPPAAACRSPRRSRRGSRLPGTSRSS